MFEFLKRSKTKTTKALELAREISQDRKSVVVHDARPASAFDVSNAMLMARLAQFAGMMYAHADDGLMNRVSGLGTGADKRSYSFFAAQRVYSPTELENMWRSCWLIKQVIGVRGADMVREWVETSWDGKDTDANRTRLIEETEAQFEARNKFEEAIYAARLYGGGAILLGTNDTNDLSQPLDISKLGKDCLKYLLVFDRHQLGPQDPMIMPEDLESGHFREPRTYTIGETGAVSGLRVHYTRLLMFRGEWLPYRAWLRNGMWHDSVLQHIIDDVKDHTMVMNQLASMFFEANVDVFKLKELAFQYSQPGGEAKLQQRFQDMALEKSNNRAIVIDGEDDYVKKGNSFAGLPPAVAEFKAWLAGAAKTPQARLFGESPGGLNSTGKSEDRAYASSILAEQNGQVRAPMRNFYRVLTRHALGAEPPNFSFTFNKIDPETPSEKATRENMEALTDQVYVATLGPSMKPVIARQIYEKGTYSRMEPADVDTITKDAAKAAELANNPPAPMAQGKPPTPGKPAVKPAQGE